jgi:hypothetical protein
VTVGWRDTQTEIEMDGGEKVKKMGRITQKLKSCESERIEEQR